MMHALNGKTEELIEFKKNKDINYYVHLILYIEKDNMPILKFKPYFTEFLQEINANFEIFIY